MNLIEAAKDLGFVAVGVTSPHRPLFFDKFREWIKAGKHGEMAWLMRHMALREDPARLIEGCRSVVSLAYPYSALRPATPDGFFAARYTEPHEQDYHRRVRKIAAQLAGLIESEYPGAKTRICIDSAPILERSFAYSAGIGFIGKNNMLILPGHGSYVFLTEILTTARIHRSGGAPMKSRCGDCQRCVVACPSGALEAPFSIDASRCLSYLSIEMKKMVDKETGRNMGRCFFGCDVCQEVCPFNPKEIENDLCLPSLKEMYEMDKPFFASVFGKTAFSRAGLEKIRGNIAAVTGERDDGIL